MNLNNKAAIEAVKEVLRIGLFAAVGAIIAAVANMESTSTTAIVLILLRAVDKYLHKSENKLSGIAPF